jgi:hypothetical protein
MQQLNIKTGCGAPRGFWPQQRQASLNWLALGLLLAAWNGADNSAADRTGETRRRPESLRGYSSVSVRAAMRSDALER